MNGTDNMRSVAIDTCMAANKIKGIRAALCYDIRTVINGRGTTTLTF